MSHSETDTMYACFIQKFLFNDFVTPSFFKKLYLFFMFFPPVQLLDFIQVSFLG